MTVPRFVPGLFQVNLAPSEVIANGGWRVKGGEDPNWIRGTNLYYPLIAGPFNIEFEPVRGYSAPPTRSVKIVVNQTTIIDAAYNLVRFTPPSRLDSGGFLMTLSGGKGRVYSFEGSSDLVHWTNLLSLTNWSGTMAFTNAPDRGSGMGFYRAKEQPW